MSMKMAVIETFSAQLYSVSKNKWDAQRMLADITILQNDLDSAQVIKDEARRSVGCHVRGVGSESEDAQSRGHKW